MTSPTIYRFPCTARSCEERFSRKHIGGSGEAATFENESLGWWLTIRNDFGADISYPLGPDKPDFSTGDKLRLTLEKIT